MIVINPKTTVMHHNAAANSRALYFATVGAAALYRNR
jgi:hypothetical protein